MVNSRWEAGKGLRGCAAVLAGVVAFGVAGSAVAADYTMKFAVSTQNEPMHEYMKRYEVCLEDATEDRIDVKLFPGGTLGGPKEMIEGLQLGTLEAMFGAGQHLKGVDKRYGVLDAPGLFTSIAHANAAYWDPDFREAYLTAGKDKGLTGIGIFAYGPSSYQTKNAVTELADFQGKKFRILATEIELKLMDFLGATGIQVGWPEIVPALQRGQIDGVRANIAIAGASKFYTVAPHVTLTNEAIIGVVASVGTKFFNELPEDLQQSVLECGESVEKTMEDFAIEFDANARKVWEEAGGEVHSLSDAEQEELLNRAAEIGKEVIASDPELEPLYNALATAAQENAPQ